MEGGSDNDVENMIDWELSLMKLNSHVVVEILKKILKLADNKIFGSPYSSMDRFADAMHRAFHDRPVWQTLDLSMLKSHYVRISPKPYVYVHSQFDRSMADLLYVVLKLSQGNITTLIFHYNLYLTNDQFTYTAQRCPRLRRLVFVSWNRIKKRGICNAIQGWKDLESLTMPSISDPEYVYKEISMHCKNFKELKIMGRFEINQAESLAAHLPHLRALSLRCTLLHKEALICILEKMEELEVLNISHCLVVEEPGEYRVVVDIDGCICEKASKLREFVRCVKARCRMCERIREDEGFPRWYKYEEGFWKHDEVSSLAL